MKKILFVTNDFGPRAGGIETFVIGLIERLSNCQVTVYTSSQGQTRDYDAAWQSQYGVAVIRDRSKILLPTPRVIRAIARLVQDENLEIVAFGAAAPLAIMSSALRRAGAKQIVALTHGHEVWWSKLFPFSLIMRAIGTNTDALTYLGEFTRSAISTSLTVQARDKMVKIAPGIDTDHFSPVDSAKLRAALNLENKKVIISVGRLVHRKGQDRLIESMPEILAHTPEAHLVLVGEGTYREHLVKLVEKNHVEKNVTFIGRIQYADLPTYICLGEVFAMPSRSRFFGLEVEGLGIVYLEASACGVPVIAGSSGGAPDAVLDGVSGVVVDGLDNSAIAKAVIKILNDPLAGAEMGRAGRAWIVENWRWQIWAQKFENLLLN